MSKLVSKLKNTGLLKRTEILSDSDTFNVKDCISTDLPILNLAFSGKLDGGLVPGITIFAGESKTFKTMLALYCIKAYQEKYPESVILYYDSEFGTTPSYLKFFDIDTDKILHIPINNIEELKMDIVQKLKEIDRGEKVFVFIDSLGALASNKEIEDALNEKSSTDMTRAKSIRSLLRIITPYMTVKDIPCIIINHVYQSMEMFSKTIIPGGAAVVYQSNQIFVITKAQEKEKDEVVGNKFTININKSRYVKEKSKFPFVVYSDSRGIKKYSGLFDLALEFEFITEETKGWYNYKGEKKRKLELEENEEVWKELLLNEEFKNKISNKFLYVRD